MGMKRKEDYGIKDYDPKKRRPSMEQKHCPYGWFAHHSQNVLTRHINEEHWAEKQKEVQNAHRTDS